MTKNITCLQHLKTSIETSHCWSLQQCKKLEDDNKSPITFINNCDKRKQHGEAYKTTMNKIMQEIIPPQLVIFSLIHPFFFPSCLPFSLISLLNQLHFHFHNLLTYLLFFFFFIPIICPFPTKFSFIFCWINPISTIVILNPKEREEKKKWNMHIFCVLCSHYVVCSFVILPQKIKVHNKMRVLHLPRSLTFMVFLEKWGCHIVT